MINRNVNCIDILYNKYNTVDDKIITRYYNKLKYELE